MPVKFKSLDEESTVYQVARWAAKELNKKPSDLELRHSLTLWAYSVQFNWMGSIPIEELRVLSPFIDRMIDGNGPPQNLPSDYTDWRPETLRRFKDRMIAEGLWPESE
jgi:hypothetical protein